MSNSNLVIIGYIDVDPQHRARWLELAAPLVAQTRQEPGAIDYAVGADVVEPGRIILYERFTGFEAVDSHMASDYFQAFKAATRDIPIVSGPHTSRFLEGKPFNYISSDSRKSGTTKIE